MRLLNLSLIAKTISKKANEEFEEETSQQRISSRSKKIKKLGEEYEDLDVKKNSKGKKGSTGGKKNTPKSKFEFAEIF